MIFFMIVSPVLFPNPDILNESTGQSNECMYLLWGSRGEALECGFHLRRWGVFDSHSYPGVPFTFRWEDWNVNRNNLHVEQMNFEMLRRN